MTLDEAIAILSDMKIDIPVPKAAVTQIKRNLALDMAINALNCSEIPNSSDSISRQMAIDAMGKAKWAKERLEQLPSAQPEQRWIPCSERLPEYNESVLTWDGYAFCIEKRIPYIRDDDGEPIEGDWWVGDEYDEYESEYYPNLRDGAAIAWMPLPEPYRGGEK